MLKIVARLEHKIGDRLFHLTCDQDAPLGEVKEAITQFLGYMIQLEKAHSEQQKAQEEAAKVSQHPEEEKKDEQQPSDS